VGRIRIQTVVRAASIVVVLAAMVFAVYETARVGTFNPTRYFAYFTIQSNLLGVASFAWVLVRRDQPRSRALESFRGAVTGYLTVVFFVVILLLENVDVGLRLAWVDFVLHKLFPVIVVVDWLVDPPMTRLTARDAVVWLLYPLAWTGLTVARGALDGWYPYPFLDPANGGYGTVAVMVVAITGAFLAIAAFWIWIGNARGRSRGTVAADAEAA
jgi:hypothetical protein